MVKKIIILTLWVNISFAISSLELAKNLVNNSSKNSQLELLFSNNSYIDNNGNCDIAKISQILKNQFFNCLNTIKSSKSKTKF